MSLVFLCTNYGVHPILINCHTENKNKQRTFKLQSHSASLECFLMLQQNHIKLGIKDTSTYPPQPHMSHHNWCEVIFCLLLLMTLIKKVKQSKVSPTECSPILNRNCFVGLESTVYVLVRDFIFLLLQRKLPWKLHFHSNPWKQNQAAEFPILKSLWLPLIHLKSHGLFIRSNRSPKI